MKILLVGNYQNLGQESMQRFVDLLHQGLEASGYEVRVVRPPVWLGRLHRGATGLAKWIGYIDRFILYPFVLRRQVRWADVVHIADQANAVYVPHVRGKPHVLTCHDMIAIRAAEGEILRVRVGWTGRVYQRWILRNIRKAQLVACVSGRTGADVARLAGLPADRLTVIPNGLNYPYTPMEAADAVEHLRALGLDESRPYFLHVGGNQWYKNRLGVLRIFAELAQRAGFDGYTLVMAGKPWTGEMREFAEQLRPGCVVELVKVSNEQLRALYSRSEALLFPSLYEGFGWPIIEAQACGCPVVTSDGAPMSEISGGGAIYINPSNPVEAAQRIETGLIRREHLVDVGMKNAAQYSRESMFERYVQAYGIVLAQRGLASPLSADEQAPAIKRTVCENEFEMPACRTNGQP